MSEVVTASVIIIGNEILSGRTKDVNLNHLAVTLGGWGIQVQHARVIPDLPEVIVQTVNECRRQYDYVFTTGGIGPTHDDITAQCVADAFAKPLYQHPEIAQRITAREAPEDVMRNRLLMARVPEGAGLIDNPSGGPQGFFIENVYVMAGIPMVMQAMLSSLEGKLKSGDIVYSHSVKAYLGESQISSQLAAIQDSYPQVDIGSYPFYREDRYGTTLVIRGTSKSVNAEVANKVLQAVLTLGEEAHDLGEGE